MTNNRKFGARPWENRLKWSLLLLAVPFLSAFVLSAQGDTIVGRYLKTRMGIFGKSSYLGPTDHWLIRRVDGQYEVQKVQGHDDVPPERRGLVMSTRRIRIDSRSGFWAPTRIYYKERWGSVTFSMAASDDGEYGEAIGDVELVQSMLDHIIPHVPDRDPNLVETRRYSYNRYYSASSPLITGYIHNAIVLLCAGAGFFELGRAIRQRRRERSAGVQRE